jgi:hypothetical protein
MPFVWLMKIWNDFFQKDKIVFTGNPVRQDLLNIDSKRQEGIELFQIRCK